MLNFYEILGYVGAVGCILFGADQLKIIHKKKRAREISIHDHYLRVIYSILLGVYAIHTNDTIFIIVNFGAALISFAIAYLSDKYNKAYYKAKAERYGHS